MIAGSLTVVGPIYQELSFIPSFLGALNGNMEALGKALLRLPGPQGHIIGVQEGQEPFQDPCLLLLGADCP